MNKIKLYKTLVDETWFQGEPHNPQVWQQFPQTHTEWNQDFEEEIQTYLNAQNNLEEFEADAVEIRFCFIEIDEQEFLNEAGFDESQLNLDDDRMQDALNYFVDWNWTEVSIKLIENPKWNDGEIIDKSHYYPIYQDQKKKCCNADCFDFVDGDSVYCSFHKSL